MATIKIGSARHDENSAYSGGRAGDQDGTEVSTQAMYAHAKGWRIIRPKTKAQANKISAKMKAACANDKIGYDQSNRLAIIKDGTGSETATECDCSSLVRACVQEGLGITVSNFTTSNEAAVLLATGKFEDAGTYTSQSKTPVYNGDILVTLTKGHTAIVVSGSPRKNLEDSTSSTTTSTSSSGSTTASTTTSTAYTSKLEVDGLWGKKTTKRLQTVLGTTVDGTISSQSVTYKSSNPGLLAESWEWVAAGTAKGSPCIKALQKEMGMTAANRDGIWGKKTAKKLEARYGLARDGFASKPSKMVKKLQQKLNNGTV